MCARGFGATFVLTHISRVSKKLCLRLFTLSQPRSKDFVQCVVSPWCTTCSSQRAKVRLSHGGRAGQGPHTIMHSYVTNESKVMHGTVCVLWVEDGTPESALSSRSFDPVAHEFKRLRTTGTSSLWQNHSKIRIMTYKYPKYATDEPSCPSPSKWEKPFSPFSTKCLVGPPH